MIWHIFKKDWKLLWPLVAGAAALHILGRISLIAVMHDPSGLARFGIPLIMLGFLGGFVAIIEAVHSDAVPGVRQDWLVRPIRRRDLLAAKLLFVVLLVLSPAFVAEVLGVALNGFSVSQAFFAALSSSLFFLLVIYVPLLAFLSLTRNMADIAIYGISIPVAIGIVSALLTGFRDLPALSGGLSWIVIATHTFATLIAATAILSIQYFRRKTFQAQCFAAAATVAFAMISAMPSGVAFAIQQRFSRNPGAASPVALAFQPSAGRLRQPFLKAFDGQLHLPMQVIGLPPDSILESDSTTIRITAAGGRTIAPGFRRGIRIRNDGPARTDRQFYFAIGLPNDMYARLQDQPMQIDIEHSLTLLRLSQSHAIPATDGQQTIPGMGRCDTKVDALGTSILLTCRVSGRAPSCATYFLENASTGMRNPEIERCNPDYGPVAFSGMETIFPFGMELPFRDVAGLAKYPVDGSQLRDSRVVIRYYRAEDHFTRHTSIPNVRLSDWLPQ